VDVLFSDEKTRQFFSRLESLQRQFGAVGAKKIALRLQQLQAAPTLAHMRRMPGRCHALTADRVGSFAVDVHHPHRLVFRPHPPIDGGEDGDPWRHVEAVTIIEVVDYH
jgi:proteic killer suppression protein